MAYAPERNKEISRINKEYRERCSAHLTRYPDIISFMGEKWQRVDQDQEEGSE